jgi:hypothetical protein
MCENVLDKDLLPPRLILEIDIGELLSIVIADNKAGVFCLAKKPRRFHTGANS